MFKIFIIFLFYFFNFQNLKAEEKIKLNFEAIPKSYKGNCPKEFTFKGIIVAKVPMVVKYKILRSDGATAPIQIIDFKYPGEKEVIDKWKISASYKGWEQIEILEPVNLKSNKAEFVLECSDVITAYIKPDLTVEKLFLRKVDSINNQKIKLRIEVSIKNLSTTPSGPFITTVEGAMYPPGTLYEIGRKSVNGLQGGKSLEFSFEEWFPASKDIKILAIVDKENSIEESNEKNNQKTEVWK